MLRLMRVFAGDVVPKKKPDPAIYLLAAQEPGVNPARYVYALRAFNALEVRDKDEAHVCMMCCVVLHVVKHMRLKRVC
jgi:hypothetical protein